MDELHFLLVDSIFFRIGTCILTQLCLEGYFKRVLYE